jgi:hypothetical protein
VGFFVNGGGNVWCGKCEGCTRYRHFGALGYDGLRYEVSGVVGERGWMQEVEEAIAEVGGAGV